MAAQQLTLGNPYENTPEFKWFSHTDEETNIPMDVATKYMPLILSSCLGMVANSEYEGSTHLLLNIGEYNLSFERQIFEFVQNLLPEYIITLFKEVILISLRRDSKHVQFIDAQTYMAIKFNVWTCGVYTAYFTNRRKPGKLFHTHKWIITNVPKNLRKNPANTNTSNASTSNKK